MSNFAHTFNVFEPPPRYNVAEWADEFRYLSSEASAKHGKYRTSFAPYQREPQACIGAPDIQHHVWMIGSQLMKTECLNNVVGYFIDAEPASILMVQPTIEFGESWSKERFTPMVRDTPRLANKVADARSRDSGNTILHKLFPGGNIAVVGANAPSGLAGRPRRVVLLDEVDRYQKSAGTEGDPVSLAIRRTDSFWNAVIVMTSTPTTKGVSRIENAFEQTDQRKWFCPCHACRQHQVLVWKQVKWPDDEPEKAWYECEHCAAHWTDKQRRESVMAGEWRATAPFNGKRGYWLNGINSPFRHKTGYVNRLHQMVAEFLEAKHGGPETLKTWTNTFLAETWEDEGETLSVGDLISRLEDYGPALPDGALVLTIGGDVQKDRIEAEAMAWGDGEECWGVKLGRFVGDTEKPAVYEQFRNWCAQEFEHPRFGAMHAAAICVDARHRTDHVYRFARENAELNIYPVMGAVNPQRRPVMVPTHRSRSSAFQVDTHHFKTAIYSRLRITEPGPRFCHFPREYDEEYFLQLTAEKAITKYLRGFKKVEWEVVRGNKRNEALDIRVYNHSALFILNPNWTQLKQNLEKRVDRGQGPDISNANANEAPSKPEPMQSPRRLVPLLPRRNSFVSGWRK